MPSFVRWLPHMTINVLVILAFTMLGGTCATGEVEGAADPRVVIDTGELEGTHFGANPEEVAFLGIPYAAPPTGKWRWRPPQAAPSWQGVRKAAAFGPACPQLASSWLPEMLGRRQMVTGEACLYLNVWTTQLHSTAKAPVMVWIHGGGNIEGSQEWPPLGPTLAKHGVVVVTINYRLGVFGFLSHPALSTESAQHSSGNYGLLDQIEALKWVQRNIEKFGGDPRNVTAFGASSGSLDICDLMASPLSTGLFQKAILQSGFCVDSMSATLSEAEKRGNTFVQSLGVLDDAHTLEKLRALPAEQVLQSAANDGAMDFDPVVDGWILPAQPSRTFAQGKQARMPVIVGSNSDEVSIFASPIVGGTSYRPKTVSEYRDWLRHTFHELAQEAFQLYPADSDRDVPKAFLDLDSDFQFGFGAWLLARETQAIGENAFLYNLTYAGKGEFAALGAFHSEESILLSKRYWTSWVSSPNDGKLSNIIINYWTQFAGSSHPTGPDAPPWPPYDPRRDLCQELGSHVGQIQTPRSRRFNIFQKVLNQAP